MVGLICWKTGREKNGTRTLCGARFCAVYVLRGTGLRAQCSADRAARYLRRHGVKRAVFPAEYPYRERFVRRGIVPHGDAALRQEKAAELALYALEKAASSPGNARVALLATSPSGALEKTAFALVPRLRYLTICAPEADRLARMLRWDWGVSVHTLRRGAPVCADLAVVFDDAEWPCVCPCLRLKRAAVRFSAPLPAESEIWERGELIAALFAAGALRAEKIGVQMAENLWETGEKANFP